MDAVLTDYTSLRLVAFASLKNPLIKALTFLFTILYIGNNPYFNSTQ